jgi:hypothetical protein
MKLKATTLILLALSSSISANAASKYDDTSSYIELPPQSEDDRLSWVIDKALDAALGGLKSGAKSVLKSIVFGSSGESYVTLSQESLDAIRGIVVDELEQDYIDEFESDLNAFQRNLEMYADNFELKGEPDLDLLSTLAIHSSSLVNNKIFHTNFGKLELVTELYAEAAMLRTSVLIDLTAAEEQSNDFPKNQVSAYMLPKLKSLSSNTDYYISQKIKVHQYSTSQCEINRRTCFNYQTKSDFGYISPLYKYSMYGSAASNMAWDRYYEREEIQQDNFKGSEYDEIERKLTEISNTSYVPQN